MRQVGNVICHNNKGGNDEYISVSSCSLQWTVTVLKRIKYSVPFQNHFFALTCDTYKNENSRSMMSNKSRNLLKPKSAPINRVYSGVRNAENITQKPGYGLFFIFL